MATKSYPTLYSLTTIEGLEETFSYMNYSGTYQFTNKSSSTTTSTTFPNGKIYTFDDVRNNRNSISCNTFFVTYASNPPAIEYTSDTYSEEVFNKLQNSYLYVMDNPPARATLFRDISHILKVEYVQSYPQGYVITLDFEQLTDEDKEDIKANYSNYLALLLGEKSEQKTKYTFTHSETNCTLTTTTQSEYDENTDISLEYSVADGYIFSETGISCNLSNQSITISEDKTTLTIIGTVTENTTVSVSAIEDTTIYQFTHSETNCTLTSAVSSEYPENTNISLVYTCVKPYYFDVTGITQNLSNFITKISDDKLTLEIYGTITTNTRVEVATIEGETKYSITHSETNCTLTSEIKDEYSKGETVTLVYTCSSPYVFENVVPTVTGFESYSTTISEDYFTLTIVGVIEDNVTVNVESDKHGIVTITGAITNASCNYNSGDVILKSKNIKIVANSGYSFTSTYTYKSGVVTYNFTKSDDNTILSTTSFGKDVTLDDNYVATKDVEKIGSFTNLYKVTNDILTKLSKVRFVENTSSTSSIDYGEFITALYILPLNLPVEIIGDESSIILGKLDSNVVAPLLTNYKYEFNFGTIHVTPKYNNVYDYINTTVTLKFPWFNDISLPVETVIDKDITLKLFVDLYSGSATLNVYSSFTDSIVYTYTSNIVTQIPFIQKQNNSIVNQLSNVLQNIIDTPFIEVVRNVPYYTNDIFGKNTIDFDVISSVNGYCEIEKVELLTSATNDEKEDIENLLNKGVFINV